VRQQHLRDRLGQRGVEHPHGLDQVGVFASKLGAAGGREIERIAARAKAVPAKLAVPVPVQVRAIEFLERHAAAIRRPAALGIFG
jgi:hypothetical protein